MLRDKLMIVFDPGVPVDGDTMACGTLCHAAGIQTQIPSRLQPRW